MVENYWYKPIKTNSILNPMNPISDILAKSPVNGGTNLIDHLTQVAAVIAKFAVELGFEVRTAIYGAYLHDIGKAHPLFQARLFGKFDKTQLPFRHEIASIFFLQAFDKTLWLDLIDIIIAHHRSPINDVRKQGLLDMIEMEGVDEVFEFHSAGWDEWSPSAINILNELGIIIDKISLDQAFDAFSFAIEHCEAKKLNWSRWKGLLVGADHLASALVDSSYKISEKLFKSPDTSFFNSEQRKSNIYPLSLVDTNDSKKHTLVVAPTGAGKTDFLIKRCKGRIFYTLPFQASINAMYERLKSNCPKDTDIRLLHAASSVVVNNNSYEEKALQPMIGSSIKVLTPHQLAALICGTRGFETIALDIEGCDVILDEIHSYSDVAQSMVLEIIKVLIKLKCNIHLGSATMPSDLISKIIDLLGGKNAVFQVNLKEDELKTFDRHKIIKHENETSAFQILEEAIANKEKILIVSNRVDIAQKRYSELKEKFKEIPILLLHSRFRRIDRSSLENELITKFNDRNKLPGSCIVISTQVVEVSLDISFDVMITDSAPLDSLIQRFGRINRVRFSDTIKNKTIKNIHVIAPPDSTRDCLPYKKELVDKSFELLPNNDVLHETDIQKLIDCVYPEIQILPIDVHLAWDNDQFLLTELCHLPKATLLEMLNIDSATCIRFSDQELYESGKLEDRLGLEIPVPRSVMFRKFTNYGKSDYGNKPLIVDDKLYDAEIGLQWTEIEQFI